MLGANNAAFDLEQIQQYLDGNKIPLLEKENFPFHNSTPAPQVEFEIRHTREHLEKLKFNWLELETKGIFLSHLVDTEAWRSCQTTRWTPGELKQLERRVEPSKSQLKLVKGEGNELLSTIEEDWTLLVDLEGNLVEKRKNLENIIANVTSLSGQVSELNQKLPIKGSSRSVEELQAILDEQIIGMEKRTSALERQKGAIADLERLFTLHQQEICKLEREESDLSDRRKSILKRQENGSKAHKLSVSCQWYTQMLGTLGKLTGCKVEMVQSGYLLVSVQKGSAQVLLHLTIDTVTGQLLNVKVGSTSATPKRQWKDLVDAAIEFNDIPFLIRSIMTAISSTK